LPGPSTSARWWSGWRCSSTRTRRGSGRSPSPSRTIDVNSNKKGFVLNPTSCRKLQFEGTLEGGGADPNNPGAFSSVPVTSPFQASGCKKLRFRPRLKTKILSGRKSAFRAQNPKFRATLTARKGDANISKATLTLPKAVILDQAHIGTVCTKPKLEAGQCPKNSVYGHAMAKSPLVGKKLKGPVYLVPSKHILPDLLVALNGQVDVHLHGVTKSVHGRLRTVFSKVPDVPVSKFVITMNGGKRGLLTNTKDLCARPLVSRLTLKGQNGKRVRRKRLPLAVPACGGGRR
jgi:hypothetical protein